MRYGDSDWIKALLPLIILAVAFGIGYAFNFFVGIALLVIAIGMAVSRLLQRSRPPDLGE